MSIFFDGSQIGLQLGSIEYNPNYTVANMYDYLVQNCQLDRQQYCLTLDGQTMLNQQDNSPISQYFPANSALYVLQVQQPAFNIFFEGQSIMTSQLPNMPIIDLLTHLQSQGVNLGQNVQVDFYDQNSSPLFTGADINEGLYTYINGNQNVIINLSSIQQPDQQQQKGSNKQGSIKQNIGANELLQSLILLKNVSLLIDPNGQFVVYKFHFPTMIQGYLQKSKGKDPANITHFSVVNSDWIEKNNIKYCSFDDYGFAIVWEDGNISSVKIRQQ